MSRTCRAHERGFTLVELMYALGYFMLGLTGLVSFQVMGAFTTQRAGDITLATNLTTATIENLRVQTPTSVVNAAQPIVTNYNRYGVKDALPTYFTVSANASQASGNRYYDLSVSTSWTQGVSIFVHSIRMQTRIPAE